MKFILNDSDGANRIRVLFTFSAAQTAVWRCAGVRSVGVTEFFPSATAAGICNRTCFRARIELSLVPRHWLGPVTGRWGGFVDFHAIFSRMFMRPVFEVERWWRTNRAILRRFPPRSLSTASSLHISVVDCSSINISLDVIPNGLIKSMTVTLCATQRRSKSCTHSRW